MKIIIDKSINQTVPDCRLGYHVIRNARIRGTPPSLVQEFLSLQKEVAKMYNLEHLATVPRFAAIRSMLKRPDFEPSRYRSASEDLVRRVLLNENVYFGNSAVDANNYCAMKYLLPFSLCDLEKITGSIRYEVSEDGECETYSGQKLPMAGKPFLSDDLGGFGSPASDAKRTAVSLNTRHLLTVVYATAEVTAAELEEMLAFSSELLMRYNGGVLEETAIVHTDAV